MIDASAAWWVGEAIADTQTKVFAVTAGLGSGKTHGFCQWHLNRVLDNKNAKYSAFTEPIYARIHDTAIPTYKKVLESFGFREGEDFETLKTPLPKVIFRETGQEVHFLSADNPDKIVGVEYSHAVMDEAGTCEKEAYQNLRARVRNAMAKHRQMMIGGAPHGINWFAERFDSFTLQGWSITKTSDHIQAERKFRRFVVWTDDNPFLPEDYLDNLEDTYGHNPNLIRSYRYGEFCPLVEGAAYSNYMPQRHDTTDREGDPFRELVVCFDFNSNPMSWTAIQKCTFIEYDKRVFRYVAIDEANEGHGQLVDSVLEFAMKFPVGQFAATPIRIYGDRSGHAASHKIEGSDFDNIYKTLRELGYRNVELCATREVAPESASVDAVQRLFFNNLFLICKKCRVLRRSLLATTWKEGTRKLNKPAGETWTHASDGVKYWAWQETREETGKGSSRIYGFNL